MGAKELVRAVLDEGLRTYAHLPTPAERLERAKMDQDGAEEWIMCGDEFEGSFLWCCKFLDLDAEDIRDGAINERAEVEANKK